MLLLGVKRASILQYVSDNTEWNISERTVDNYIQEATELITKAAEDDQEMELGLAKSRLELLFQKNMQIHDYKAALQVQKERSTTLGLHKPKQDTVKHDVDHTHTVVIPGLENIQPYGTPETDTDKETDELQSAT